MYSLVARLSQPFLRPFQRVVPLVGGVDLSPIALLVVLQLIGMVLASLQMNGLP
jgi:YggT family protein